MTPARAMTPCREARTRSDEKCRRPEGAGAHLTLNGDGASCTGARRAPTSSTLREEAEFVVGMLGHEMDVDPLGTAPRRSPSADAVEQVGWPDL
jgi:hypothetical protein